MNPPQEGYALGEAKFLLRELFGEPSRACWLRHNFVGDNSRIPGTLDQQRHWLGWKHGLAVRNGSLGY